MSWPPQHRRIEDDLARALTDAADRAVPEAEVPPPFRQLPRQPAHSGWMLPLMSAAAVIVLVGGTLVTTQLISADRSSRPGNSTGGPTDASPTMSASSPDSASTSPPPSHQTSTPTPSATPTSPPAPVATGLDQQGALTAPWTARVVEITPTSLGAVQVGMSKVQAEAAAQLPFDGLGDGAMYPQPTDFPGGGTQHPHLYLEGPFTQSELGCVGASLGDTTQTPASSPAVVTAEGFRLGGSVAQLKATYPTGLRFVPMPTSGRGPTAGYVLSRPGGTMIFAVSRDGSIVTEIAGSPGPLTPSHCPG